MASLRVAIVGSGSVGTTLGHQLASRGASVKYGSRDPSSAKVQELLKSQTSASADTIEKAVSWAEAVIVATPGFRDEAGAKAVASSLGAGVKGKVVIDATNPLSPYPGLENLWNGTSGGGVAVLARAFLAAVYAGELLASALPDSHVYKAFNHIPVEQMAAPDGNLINGQQLTALLAGGPQGREIAEKVVANVGFIPCYVGPIRFARNIEALAELFVQLSVPGLTPGAENWGRAWHFQVIKK